MSDTSKNWILPQSEEMVLHSFRRCPYAIRVRMTLEEKKIPYRVIEEKLSEPSEQLLKINPEGSVPVLIHRGKVIIESAVITEYIEREFPAHPLMPSTLESQNEVREITESCGGKFKADLDIYKYEYKNLNEEKRSELLARLSTTLLSWNQRLAKHAFLIGNELTLADIHVFPFYRQLTRVEGALNILPFSHLNAWLTAITSRPSFIRVIEKKTNQ